MADSLEFDWQRLLEFSEYNEFYYTSENSIFNIGVFSCSNSSFMLFLLLLQIVQIQNTLYNIVSS